MEYELGEEFDHYDQQSSQNNDVEQSLDGPDPALTDESPLLGSSLGKVGTADIYTPKLQIILEKIRGIEEDADKSVDAANADTRKFEQMLKGYEDIMSGNFAMKTVQMGRDQMITKLRSMRDDLLSQIKGMIISMDIIKKRQVNIQYSLEDINKILKELGVE